MYNCITAKMIKKITSIIFILTISFQSFSQVKDYDQTALLFGQEKLNGTARYLAMSGAFGALGGDLSAIEINPAGMAIFNNNEAAITLGVNSISNNSKFYNLKSSYKTNPLTFAQGGVSFIFENYNDKWSKFAISGNISISNNFDNLITLKGNNHNSNESYFLNPDPTADLYNIVEVQKNSSDIRGTNTKTTIAISTKYNKKTYFGLSVVNNSIDYSQDILINESSKDINNNTFNGRLTQYLGIYGQGIGFNFGVISMPIKNLRLGFSFQTPTWYTLTEEFNENMIINLSNASVEQPDNQDWIWEYQVRTPCKTTGSIAYVFGKEGLISLDYSYKDFSRTKLSPTDEFETDFNYNNAMQNDYTGVSTLNIGGEYRLKYISLRAGYHYETSPYSNALDSEDFNGYSYGLGFKTGNYSKLDFAFNQTNTTDKSYYLSDSSPILSNNKTNNYTVTYSISF